MTEQNWFTRKTKLRMILQHLKLKDTLEILLGMA